MFSYFLIFLVASFRSSTKSICSDGHKTVGCGNTILTNGGGILVNGIFYHYGLIRNPVGHDLESQHKLYIRSYGKHGWTPMIEMLPGLFSSPLMRDVYRTGIERHKILQRNDGKFVIFLKVNSWNSTVPSKLISVIFDSIEVPTISNIDTDVMLVLLNPRGDFSVETHDNWNGYLVVANEYHNKPGSYGAFWLFQLVGGLTWINGVDWHHPWNTWGKVLGIYSTNDSSQDGQREAPKLLYDSATSQWIFLCSGVGSPTGWIPTDNFWLTGSSPQDVLSKLPQTLASHPTYKEHLLAPAGERNYMTQTTDLVKFSDGIYRYFADRYCPGLRPQSSYSVSDANACYSSVSYGFYKFAYISPGQVSIEW